MLEPDTRSLLLDALRPPDGYQLDRAIGTTFSLDLNALLTAPLAFAMFDAESSGEGNVDVIALLEATRRYAGRIDIFCQAGRISVPRNYQRVYSNVEGTVHEAIAPTAGGLFHPKVWAIRFTSRHGNEPQFRLLTLSRNLTFDRSWDVIVRLDGERATPKNRHIARVTNEPLVTFLKELPEMSVLPLPDAEKEELVALAKSFADVEFEIPRGFREIYFDSYGINEYNWTPFQDGHDRAFIISPFVGDELLEEATESGSHHVLISRPESLDALSSATLDSFEHVLILDSSVDGSDIETTEDELSGLHAKVYVLDYGSDTSVIAGSPNATLAAFTRNVEFVVELRGRRQRIGIDTFIRTASNDSKLFDLLVPYSRSRDRSDPTSLTDAQILERRLDSFRHDIAAVGLRARVLEGESSDEFSLTLSSDRPLPADDGASIVCYPITLGNAHAQPLHVGSVIDTLFPKISFEAISSFFAFNVSMSEGAEEQSISFVVNAELTGEPQDRHQRILSGLLSNKAKVLRYLLFLLSEPAEDGHVLGLLGIPTSGEASDGAVHHLEIPLLEALLETLAKDPSRLDPIDRLLDDLSKTPEGRELLPSGITEIWEPIWEARLGDRE